MLGDLQVSTLSLFSTNLPAVPQGLTVPSKSASQLLSAGSNKLGQTQSHRQTNCQCFPQFFPLSTPPQAICLATSSHPSHTLADQEPGEVFTRLHSLPKQSQNKYLINKAHEWLGECPGNGETEKGSLLCYGDWMLTPMESLEDRAEGPGGQYSLWC